MGTSARIIRVLNDTYTLEIEVEVENIDELAPELMKTDWGRKMAYLLTQMLPQVPEWRGKEEMERMEKERQEYEEKLRAEGFRKGKEEGKKEAKEEIEELEERIKELETELETLNEIREKVKDFIEWEKQRNEQAKEEEKTETKAETS